MATYVTWPPSGGGGGPATDLDTTGAAVNISASAPPVLGQVLVATSPTTAVWSTLPPAEVFGLKFGDVLVSQNVVNAQTGSVGLGAGAVSILAQNATAIGYANTIGASGLGSVVVGYNSSSTSNNCIVVGGTALASQNLGIAIGNASQVRGDSAICIGSNAQTIRGTATLVRAIVIGADSSITITNSGTATNTMVIGPQSTASTTTGNMNSTLLIGASSTLTGTGAGTCNQSTFIGPSNAVSWVGGNADNCQVLGQNNTLTTTSGAISRTTIVGQSNTFNNTTVSATNNEIHGSSNTINGGCVQNLVCGRSNTVAATVSYSVTIGSGLSNTTDESIVIGTNTNPLIVITSLTANNIAIGKGAAVNAGNDTIVIGRFAGVNASDTISIGRNSSANYTEAVSIGRAAFAGGTQAVAIGYNTNSGGIDGVAIGNAATSTTYAVSIGANSQVNQSLGVALGNLSKCRGNSAITIGSNAQTVVGSATVTRAIVVGADSSITVVNAGTSNNTMIVGALSTTSCTTGNMNNTVVLGPNTVISGTGAGTCNASTFVGSGNTASLAGGDMDNCQLLGQGNTLTTTSGSVTSTTMAGRGNTFNNTTGSGINNGIFGSSNTVNNGCNNNGIYGRSNTISAGVTYSVTIGQGLTNGTSESILMGTNSNPLMIVCPAAYGNVAILRLKWDNTTFPVTATAAQWLGGYQVHNTAAALTLTVPTGADLDAYVAITQNLFINMSFTIVIRKSGTGSITFTASAGHTLPGIAAQALATTRYYVCVREAAATWITYQIA